MLTNLSTCHSTLSLLQLISSECIRDIGYLKELDGKKSFSTYLPTSIKKTKKW